MVQCGCWCSSRHIQAAERNCKARPTKAHLEAPLNDLLSSHWLSYLQGRLGRVVTEPTAKSSKEEREKGHRGDNPELLHHFLSAFSWRGKQDPQGSHLAIVTSQRIPDLVFEPMLSDSRTGALSHAIIVP